MITFKYAENLIAFLEQKLPPRIKENLFYSKYTREYRGKIIENKSLIKPMMIVMDLRRTGYVLGITDDPDRHFFPETYILLWTKMLSHIEKYDNLTLEQEKYRLISINKACELMEVTRPTIYKLIRENEIPFVEVLSQKRIQLKDLLDYIDKNKKSNKSAD